MNIVHTVLRYAPPKIHLKCDHKIKIYVNFFLLCTKLHHCCNAVFFYFYFYQISHLPLTVTLVLSFFFSNCATPFYIIFRGNGSIRGTKPNSSMGIPYSLNLASYERTASLCNCVILSNSCCTSLMV